MARREEPTLAPIRRQPAAQRRLPAASPEQAQEERRLGAAAQLVAVHRILRRGPAFQRQAEGAAPANRTGLPDRLKSGVEALSGVSLDGVKVHYNSSKPAQLNALAYAQGGDIHLAPGQERHLPHEAWHVVQQAQGRVKPTMQMKGASINADESLEREADAMGARILQCVQRAPPIPRNARPSSPGPVVQRVIKVIGTDGKEIADVEAKLEALQKGSAGKVYDSLVNKHGKPAVTAAIRAMITENKDHGEVNLGKRNTFLARLSEYMNPKEAVAVPEEIVETDKPAPSRPLKIYGLGPLPKPALQTLSGSSTKPVLSDLGKPSMNVPKASSAEPKPGTRVVPKDLSFKPSAFHMNWNPTEGKVGAVYIRQMALVGRIENYIVVATVPEKHIQQFYALVADQAALENIQIRPVQSAQDPWAEDSGDFHTDGSIHVPGLIKYGPEAPSATIPAAREKRGYYGDKSHKEIGNLARIGASISEREIQKDKLALAEAIGTKAFQNASHIEGGNILTGTAADGKGYALVGRDGFEATRALIASRADKDLEEIEDDFVRAVIGGDYGIAANYVIAVEQPGEFHLDMSMVVMGPGQVILNDSLQVYELQQEWIVADYLKLKPKDDKSKEHDAWVQLGNQVEAALADLEARASRMSGYERRAALELFKAGMKLVRLAGAFPPSKFLPGMNFLNGEGGVGADDKPFFVTNGGDPRAEAYVAEQYLKALGTGLQRLYFLDPAASKASLEQTDGGLGCRTKGEGSVVTAPK